MDEMNKEIMKLLKYSGLTMIEKDLGEPYTYLELLQKTYLCCEDEVRILLDTILQIYSMQFYRKDLVSAIHELRNPRNAGRKCTCSDADMQRVKEKSGEGLSIRKIAAEPEQWDMVLIEEHTETRRG
jgi:hypothetical protein